MWRCFAGKWFRAFRTKVSPSSFKLQVLCFFMDLKLFKLRWFFSETSETIYPVTSLKTQILDYAVTKTSEIAKVFMNFDFNENPFWDSSVITREQADIAKIKLACMDIFLENAPKKSEIDNMLELCEQDGIYKMQFLYIFKVSALFPHQVGNSIHCNATSSRNTSTVLYV